MATTGETDLADEHVFAKIELMQRFEREHEIEHLRRSLAMLPAGSDALKREEAMALLGRLRDVTARLRHVEEGLRVLLADEPAQ